MVSKLINTFKALHKSFLPKELENDKRKKTLFYISLYAIIGSVFLTIFGQLPVFASRSLTQLFQIGWVLVLIPLLMLDYKKVLNSLGTILCILLPFVIYCLIALIFKVRSISYSGTKLFFLSSYIFLIGSIFSKYKNKSCIKTICVAFFASSLIYALVVFFTKLVGYDISNQIYIFGDKNSAGPIFMSAAVLSFYIFSGKKPILYILRWGPFAFFLLIVALSKTRAVLIVVPIILLMLLFYEIRSTKIFLIICGVLLLIAILLFVVPQLYQKIIVNILFNGKTTIDEIFSGRLTQIVTNLQNLKPLLGTGNSYFDCMPISLLCTYGIIGLISLLPILILPYFIIFSYKKHGNDSKLKNILFILGIMFLVESLFEGFGYFGTGAKVFILWLIAGLNCDEIILSFKPNKISKVPLSIGSIFSKTPRNAIPYIIQSGLVITSLFMCFSNNIIGNIGSLIVDRLPSTNVIADYIEVKDIQIKNPVGTMCVGQRITFGVNADPIDAEDKTVYWNTGWIQNPTISVNPTSGEVTANRSGSALLHINRFRVGPNGTYIQFGISEVNQYLFDKMYISVNEFNQSFEHQEDEQIELGINCTSHIYYDNYYLPKESLLTYVSSSPDVAIVENNTIKALSSGTTEITAKVTTNKGETTSINKVTVNVVEEQFNPITTIGLDLPNQIYQYQQYSVTPVFNDEASDKNYDIEITGLDYKLENKLLTFNEAGQATIKITSLSNPDIYQVYEYNVNENHPVKFECQTNRIKIGETKNAEELGLYLVFSNGYKKTITEDDIIFDPFDFTNRAWSNQNGLTGDNSRTTIKAVKKGSIKLTYTSKIDENITNTIYITCSVYTAEEYLKLSTRIGLIFINLLAIATLLFSLFISFRQKWIIYASTSGFAVLYSLLVLFKYGVDGFSIISMNLILLVLWGVIVLHIVLKNKLPLPLIEEPIENIESNKKDDDYLKCQTINI